MEKASLALSKGYKMRLSAPPKHMLSVVCLVCAKSEVLKQQDVVLQWVMCGTIFWPD